MNICKRLGFLPFARNICKKLSNKYSQKILDHANQSAIDALKTTSKWEIKKTAGATTNFIVKNCRWNYKNL